MPKYAEYLTTQRCLRMCCALTVRLITPIDRCPRCRAAMVTVEQPQRGFEALVAVATDEILAGFDSLLRVRANAGTA
jgi:hypothetical protein